MEYLQSEKTTDKPKQRSESNKRNSAGSDLLHPTFPRRNIDIPVPLPTQRNAVYRIDSAKNPEDSISVTKNDGELYELLARTERYGIVVQHQLSTSKHDRFATIDNQTKQNKVFWHEKNLPFPQKHTIALALKKVFARRHNTFVVGTAYEPKSDLVVRPGEYQTHYLLGVANKIGWKVNAMPTATKKQGTPMFELLDSFGNKRISFKLDRASIVPLATQLGLKLKQHLPLQFSEPLKIRNEDGSPTMEKIGAARLKKDYGVVVDYRETPSAVRIDAYKERGRRLVIRFYKSPSMSRRYSAAEAQLTYCTLCAIGMSA